MLKCSTNFFNIKYIFKKTDPVDGGSGRNLLYGKKEESNPKPSVHTIHTFMYLFNRFFFIFSLQKLLNLKFSIVLQLKIPLCLMVQELASSRCFQESLQDLPRLVLLQRLCCCCEKSNNFINQRAI